MLSLLHIKQKMEVDLPLVKYLINSDDPDLLWHLCKISSWPQNPVFAQFWDELQKYTDDFGAVGEHRCDDVLYLPITTFLKHLQVYTRVQLLQHCLRYTSKTMMKQHHISDHQSPIFHLYKAFYC